MHSSCRAAANQNYRVSLVGLGTGPLARSLARAVPIKEGVRAKDTRALSPSGLAVAVIAAPAAQLAG